MFDLFVSHVPIVDMSLIKFSQESGSRRLTRNSFLFFRDSEALRFAYSLWIRPRTKFSDRMNEYVHSHGLHVDSDYSGGGTLECKTNAMVHKICFYSNLRYVNSLSRYRLPYKLDIAYLVDRMGEKVEIGNY